MLNSGETAAQSARNGAGRTPAEVLMGLVWGSTASAAVTAAAALGVADHLAGSPQSGAEVADRAGTDPDATRRLLRALAALGLVTEAGTDRFALTEVGALLRSDVPGSYRAAAKVFGDETLWQGSRGMVHSVRTGEPALPHFLGAGLFDHLRRDAGAYAEFNDAMGQASRTVVPALVGHVDFTPFRTVVDVGGGDGTLLAGVLRTCPGVRGVVFDTAEGAADAAATLGAAGVAERAEIRTGDFFAGVPAAGDLYVLKNILHDWETPDCARILTRCREAIAPQGRLMIVAQVLPDVAAPGQRVPSHLNDLTMLVNLGGRERTGAEYGALLEASGFALTGVDEVPGSGGFSVVHAVPGPFPAVR
ncbi:methyltransferase [Streptomyces chrestomyceticus]|uniref:methyltransferase n=1 Tax=Streptomyces chrestomyceticus TaxID=68185 RepID=UPI0035A9126F